MDKCTLRLPTVFPPIGNLSNKNQQLMIYGIVIAELEKKEYKVEIDVDTQEWTVSGWGNSIDDDLNKDMIHLFASRTIQTSTSKLPPQ